MFKRYLAFSSLVICLAVSSHAAPQETPSQERKGQESPETERSPTEEMQLELLGIESQTQVDRDFGRARKSYKEVFDRILERHKARDPEVDVESVLRQWIMSVLITRADQGDIRPQDLEDLRAFATLEEAPEDKEFATLWNRAFDQAIRHERVTSRVMLPKAAQPVADQEDPVRRAVEHFLTTSRDHNAIVQLGRRALPILQEKVAQDLDRLSPDRGRDTLVTLARIDDAAAAKFVLDNFDRGGTLWRSRILRLFEPEAPYVAYHDSEAWSPSRGTSEPQLLRAYWLNVLERLTAFEDVRRDLIEALDHPPLQRVLTPPLQDFLELAILSEDPGARSAAKSTMRHWPTNKKILPIIRAAAKSPHEDVRLWATNHLTRLKPSPALWALASDPSKEVRKQVVESLNRRSLFDLDRHTGITRVSGASSEEREMLRRFLSDSEPAIRRAATEVASELESFRVPEETLVALLREQDPELIDDAIWWLDQLPSEQRFVETMRLAASKNSDVLFEVDQLLFIQSDLFTPDQLVALVTARLANENRKFWTDMLRPNDLLSRASEAEGAIGKIAEWAMESDRVFDVLTGTTWSLQLDAETYERLLAASTQFKGRFGELRRIALKRNATQFDSVWLSFAKNRIGNIITDLQALSLAARSLPSESVAVFRERLDEVVTGVSMGWLPGYIADVPAASRNAMIWMLLQHAGVSPEAKDELARRYEAEAPAVPGLEDTSLRIQGWILDAYVRGDREVERFAMKRALEHMAIAPATARPEILMRAIRDEFLCNSARDALGALRDPSHLEALRDVLRTPASFEGHTAAIDAVQAFMSDEAAEILIEAAGFLGNATLRKHALDRVEGIREYQDAASRWAARKASHQNRESVLIDLVDMLDDSDMQIRVEAIRGLGTFEAAEYLPRLIRLLVDPQEEVRDAARAAIERIHAGSTPQAK